MQRRLLNVEEVFPAHDKISPKQQHFVAPDSWRFLRTDRSRYPCRLDELRLHQNLGTRPGHDALVARNGALRLLPAFRENRATDENLR